MATYRVGGDAVGDAIGIGGQLSRMAWEVGDAIGMGEWEDRTATRTLNSIALLTTLCT